MGKTKGWFSLVKKLFVSDSKPKPEKKLRRKKWLFGRLKIKQYPAITAPPPSDRINEAEEEQRRRAMAVAIATAAAAEAAVAALHAAAEVVRLTGTTQSHHLSHEEIQNLAATRIQAAYRAHLARKALRALKGLVRLQALIRGQIVRRRVVTALKHQSRGDFQEKLIKIEPNNRRTWDYTVLSKEEAETLLLSKRDAMVKRERMKQYSFSNQERRNFPMPEDLLPGKESPKKSLWSQLEKSNPSSRKIYETLGTDERSKPKHRNTHKPDSTEGFNSPFSQPRRSYSHGKQTPNTNFNSYPNSPLVPTYMASTESAKAKTRSMSTPKQRLGSLDACSNFTSSYKNKFSSWSSFGGRSGK